MPQAAALAGLDPRAIWADLSQANRLYRLQSLGTPEEAALIDTLRVEGWVQRESLSELFELRIVCLSLDAAIDLGALLEQPLVLLTVRADGQLVRRSGFVRHAESLDSDGALARYRLALAPWLWLATQQAHNRVFNHRSVADIIEQVLAPYADAGPFAFSAEVAEFLADAPERTYCTQYRESDYDFLSRLLAEEGLGWRVEEDEAAPMGHKIVIFAANVHQPQDESSPARFHRQGAQEQSDAIQALARRMRQGASQVRLACWSVQDKRQVQGVAPARWPVGGPRAPRIEYDDVVGSDDSSRNWARQRALERYAGLLMDAAECRTDLLLGRSTVRTLRPGVRLAIDDAPALGLKQAPQLLLDAIEHIGINNLPRASTEAIAKRLGALEQHLVFEREGGIPTRAILAALQGQTDTAALMPYQPLALPGSGDPYGAADTDSGDPPSAFLSTFAPPDPAQRPDPQVLSAARALGYANRFSGVHEARDWRPALPAAGGTAARVHARPTVAGVHSAIVVGPQGETSPQGADALYCNARGDVRVRFHWQTDEGADPANAGARDAVANPRTNAPAAAVLTSRWIRVAQRQAGPRMGWQWLPRIGQEVLVRFVDGDVDQPIVIGTLYNGRGEGGQAPTPGGVQRGATDTSVFAQATDASPSAQINLAQGATPGHAPPWHGASAGSQGHRNAAALTGFKTREFGGTGFSQLVFDDSNSQLRVQLHTSTAHSQLNLGHLIHQQHNYRGSFRGQGMELRTDAHGALRGGKGVLLSTYHPTYSGRGGQKLEPTGDLVAGMAAMRRLTDMGKALSEAAKTHQTVQLAAQIGADKTDASVLDTERAPHAALLRTVSATVAGKSLQAAYADAGEKNVATGPDKVPHTADAVVALSAKGGLAAVAGQHVQFVSGETVTLASGEDVNLALAEELRIHAGQAFGWLAGASNADTPNGLSLIAGQDDLVFQAQHDELKVRAKGQVKLASTDEALTLAARKKIRIATTQGASITLEGGNITFQCPGKITYYATQRALAGPARARYPLPAFPRSALKSDVKFDLTLKDMPGPHGVAHPLTDWRIVRAADADAALLSQETLFSGQSDAQGKLALGDDEQQRLHEEWNRTPNRVWVVSESHAHNVMLLRDPGDWTDDEQFLQALDAMGYTDDHGFVGDAPTEDFHDRLARREVEERAGKNLLGKIKK